MASEKMAGLADLLHRFRIAAGLTQEELAERAKISARAISDLERGVRRRPHVATVRQLAVALQLSDQDTSALQLAARGRRRSYEGADQAHSMPVGAPRGVSSAPAGGVDQWQARTQRLPVGGFLGSLPSGPLVGRRDESARTLNAVDMVAAGQGQLLLLAGEPGIGKTRLAQELTRAAHERGFLVAAGRCYEPHRSMPYYPFLESLRLLYGASPPSLRDQILHRWPYLALLMPDELGPGPTSSDEAQEQERLFRAVGAFVLAAAEAGPVALALDDLHWADGASLQLLQHLARQTRGSRVLLLGTYRDVEVQADHPLDASLRDLRREQLMDVVPLRRLDRSSTTAFIEATMGDFEPAEEFAALIYRHTEGNPFFTQQVLQSLIESGCVYRDEGRWKHRDIRDIGVPESVRSVIGQRVARLRPQTQALLQEASVLGPSFAFDELVAQKAWMDEGAEVADTVDSALVDAASLRLVRAGENGMYTFDHVLTQQTLYSALSPHQRRLLHIAAGEAIEAMAANAGHAGSTRRAAELAWHFLEGQDAEKAARYSLLAGDQAESVFAHGEAEGHYRVAVELARRLDDQNRIGEAMQKLGGTMRRTGRYGEARELLEQAVQRYRELNHLEGEVRATVEIAHACVGEGEEESAIDRVQALLATPEVQGSSRALGTLYGSLAYMLFARGQYEGQLEAATRAAEVARSLGDNWLLAGAEERCGTALAMLGRQGAARPHLEEAVRLAKAVNDLDVLNLALTSLGELCLTEGRLEQAQMYWERALDVAERIGEPWVLGFALCNLSQVRLLVGEWDAASAHARRAFEVFQTGSPAWFTAYALLHLGTRALAQGDRTSGSRQLDECITIASSRGDLQALRHAQLALADYDLLEGNPESALARLEPLLDRSGFEEANVTRLLAYVVWARLEVGDTEQAEQLLTMSMERAAAHNDVLALVDLIRVQGILQRRRLKWEEAARTFDEAVSVAQSMPYPLAEARALGEYGLMLAQQGERLRARERLEDALHIFRRLGASAYIEWTEQVLITVC